MARGLGGLMSSSHECCLHSGLLCIFLRMTAAVEGGLGPRLHSFGSRPWIGRHIDMSSGSTNMA